MAMRADGLSAFVATGAGAPDLAGPELDANKPSLLPRFFPGIAVLSLPAAGPLPSREADHPGRSGWSFAPLTDGGLPPQGTEKRRRSLLFGDSFCRNQTIIAQRCVSLLPESDLRDIPLQIMGAGFSGR